MNTNEIATKADIENLLCEIRNLQKLFSTPVLERKILRSSDVRKLLNISDGTLQRLRITYSLPAQKVNGTWFYKYEDVIKMLENYENR
jgi:hypothetical protein